MAGSIVVPSPTPWEPLRRRLGLSRGTWQRSPFALRPGLQALHAEIFMSERTGDWIRVGCDCRWGYDHWHTGH